MEKALEQLVKVRDEVKALRRVSPFEVGPILNDIDLALDELEGSIENPLTAPHIGGEQNVHGD